MTIESPLGHQTWWQRGVVYQIYPRSFADSDGDGVGDVTGIETRLPYLADLGVDAIWLSPIFPSPMADFGYDVAAYCDVDPLFGTLADFDRLLAATHAAGLRLILDYVPNHTSEKHPWFVESRASRDAPKRDWYLWRDPAPGGGPPNNWRSRFGGGAWEWDAATGQYYLHSFLKEQPDLNWRNPAVRAAMYDVLRFWLDRGVDGFRIDVLWLLIKDDRFRDDPIDPEYRPGSTTRDPLLPFYNADRPEVHEIAAEMRAIADAYPGDRVLIGEIYLPVERLVTYYGRDLLGVQMPFNFQLIGAPWDAATLAAIARRYEAALPPGAWPNWVLGNHDNPRLASRIGPAYTRAAALLLLTLRGTPTLYYGDELGMTDAVIPPDRVRDPAELRRPNLGFGRDPERTPMPWDASPNGGFTTGDPWLPLGDHSEANVAALARRGDSLLAMYRAAIALRRTHAALTAGSLAAISAEDGVLRYERRFRAERLVVAINLGTGVRRVPVGEARILFTTHRDISVGRDGRDVTLRAGEGLVLELDA